MGRGLGWIREIEHGMESTLFEIACPADDPPPYLLAVSSCTFYDPSISSLILLPLKFSRLYYLLPGVKTSSARETHTFASISLFVHFSSVV